MAGVRAILWDMDGSLIDTEPLWEVATYDCSERLGRRLTPELRAKCIGNTLPDTITICANHAGVEVTDEVIARESAFMESRVAQLIAERDSSRPSCRVPHPQRGPGAYAGSCSGRNSDLSPVYVTISWSRARDAAT